MCLTKIAMPKEGESDDAVKAQASKDNHFFKGLLDMIPPAVYFTVEQKEELLGNVFSAETEEEEFYLRWKRKKEIKKKGVINPLTIMSVSEITERRIKGEVLVPPTKNDSSTAEEGLTNGLGISQADALEAKHEGKKKSRNIKTNKNKVKEMQRKESRLLELQMKLNMKLEELKARKNSGNTVTDQEKKRLRRQEKKVTSKLKNKNFKNADKNREQKEKRVSLAEGLKSPPRNEILNHNGEPVKSKFDFSVFSVGNDKSRTSKLHGKDYKKLLEKVEKRQEMVQDLKEKDLDKGRKLEEKLVWQSTMSRAMGEKVKDDPQLLKKAMKRKEKTKEQSKKKWEGRVKQVEEMKEKRQQKRQANLDKRKSDKKDKKRKKMIKKGRIIPGF